MAQGSPHAHSASTDTPSSSYTICGGRRFARTDHVHRASRLVSRHFEKEESSSINRAVRAQGGGAQQ